MCISKIKEILKPTEKSVSDEIVVTFIKEIDTGILDGAFDVFNEGRFIKFRPNTSHVLDGFAINIDHYDMGFDADVTIKHEDIINERVSEYNKKCLYETVVRSIRRYENYKFDIKEKDSEKKLAAYLKG
jgi:hypothetical protein